jgi:hypothetical protein
MLGDRPKLRYGLLRCRNIEFNAGQAARPTVDELPSTDNTAFDLRNLLDISLLMQVAIEIISVDRHMG